MTIQVLYDGWSLAYQPNSPAALHLLTLLAYCPEGIQPRVALPAQPPSWLQLEPAGEIHPMPDTPRARLTWEQRVLPRLAENLGARILHLVTANPPWTTRTPSVVSPAGYGEFLGASNRFESNDLAEPGELGGFMGRIRDAVSRGGMSRLQALFWPEDLPSPPGWAAERKQAAPSTPGRRRSLFALPPVVHPAYTGANSGAREELSSLDLPESYILYHGPYGTSALRRLLNAWSWAAGPVGEYYPLLALGLDETARGRLEALCAEYGLGQTVRSLPAVPVPVLAALYAGCSALLHPAPVSPWGGPVRSALASGKPVVAIETPLADALLGPAAYLVPPGDARALGAALITTIVEESVAERLSLAARQRAASWESAAFGPRLLEAYRALLGHE